MVLGLDCFDGTAVLDIKPYRDDYRVDHYELAEWCRKLRDKAGEGVQRVIFRNLTSRRRNLAEFKSDWASKWKIDYERRLHSQAYGQRQFEDPLKHLKAEAVRTALRAEELGAVKYPTLICQGDEDRFLALE